jgi:hypothetical protein
MLLKFETILKVASLTLILNSAACKQQLKRESEMKASVDGNPSKNSTRSKLDVNDVSILFPMPKDDSDFQKMMGLSSTPNDSVKYNLVSQSHFAQLKGVSAGQRISFPQGAPQTDYRNWRIVGFRFDPCFPRVSNSNPEACSSVELRLVAQPFSNLGGFFTSVDFTAHLVYHVNKQDRIAIANELLRLARLSPANTQGAPLGVHPGLVQEGYSGSFYSEVKTFVAKRMNVSNLAQIAFMGLQQDPEPWNFFFTNVKGDKISGANSPFSLTLIDSSHIKPSSRFADNMQKILDKNLNVSEEEMMVTRRIDNPNITTQAGTDCVSCHTTTTARLSWEAKNQRSLRFGSSNAAFIPSGNDAFGGTVTHKLAPGMQDADPWNVRNFGYFGSRPQITDRVLNETTSSAIFLNRNFLK